MKNSTDLDVLNYVIDKINSAEIITEPYPHFYIDNIFPEDFYQQLLNHLPGSEGYKKWTEVGKVKLEQYSYRDQWYLEEDWICNFPDEIRQFWTAFAGWFLGDHLANIAMMRFKDTLVKRFDSQPEQWPIVYPQAIFLRHRGNYFIGPHTDIPSKIVNILFYLPENNDAQHLGTSIYTPKEEGFSDPGTKHYDFEPFNLHSTMSYKMNSAFGFVKTNDSWHGVEKLTEQDATLSRRDAIQYMVYDNPMKAPRKEGDKTTAEHQNANC